MIADKHYISSLALFFGEQREPAQNRRPSVDEHMAFLRASFKEGIKLKESSPLLDESYGIYVPLSSISSVCIFIIRMHKAYEWSRKC